MIQCMEQLKLVVPNECCKHLIGKDGSRIGELEKETSARISIDPEAKMKMQPWSVGRTLTITGPTAECRSHAQYLISRLIASFTMSANLSISADWCGGVPGPINH